MRLGEQVGREGGHAHVDRSGVTIDWGGEGTNLPVTGGEAGAPQVDRCLASVKAHRRLRGP
jgi:hypothetical protein